MNVTKIVWVIIFVISLISCQRDSDVLPGNVTYDIVGPGCPNGIFDSNLYSASIYATSTYFDSCSNETILLASSKVTTNESQLTLSLNIPANVGQYILFSTDSRWKLCSTDSIDIAVFVEERPTPGYIDLIGLAAYRVIDDTGSYLEVTRYDEKKRWVEGRFQLKAVRYGVSSYPLPLADTLVITNGKFRFGFKRE